jgi:hypothetical protein
VVLVLVVDEVDVGVLDELVDVVELELVDDELVVGAPPAPPVLAPPAPPTPALVPPTPVLVAPAPPGPLPAPAEAVDSDPSPTEPLEHAPAPSARSATRTPVLAVPIPMRGA